MKRPRFDFRKFISRRKEPIYIVLVVFVAMTCVAYSQRFRSDDEPTVLGVSFSIKYAEELGLDWKRAMLALMDEVGVQHYRLMTYWDMGEPSQDVYDFADLDWQIDQATRHNATVSLAIGQRQPRWPECHVPDWVQDLDQATYRNELIEYMGVVINRYKDSPAIISYQVENEAANNLFGECDDYDPGFLERELQFVRQQDPDREIITNVSSQAGLTLRGPINYADKVGFTIYKRAHFEAFGNQYGWTYFFPSHWHSWRAAMIGGLHDVDIFIHELQGEPWGPRPTVELSLEEQNVTMDADKLREIVNYAESTGIPEIYLWGGEWWYWRLTEFGDKEIWNEVKDIYHEANVGGEVL